VALFYLDASALVKLVLDETESAALRTFLDGADLLSGEIALTEVPRAIRRAVAADPGLPLDPILRQAERVVGACALAPCDAPILIAAGAFDEPGLRALDAIHVALAVSVSPVDGFVTYDVRQGAAARLAGLRVVAPGALRPRPGG